LREVNANKLASHLLLPDHLVLEVPTDAIINNLREQAAEWGVSQQTLRIRLETMGLLAPEP
jgi:Zn-dependent peptidase ImmA (M78 family)